MCSKTTEKNKNKTSIRQMLYKNTLPDMILVSWSAQMLSINNQHAQVKVSVLEYFGMKHVLFQYHTMWKMYWYAQDQQFCYLPDVKIKVFSLIWFKKKKKKFGILFPAALIWIWTFV